MKLRDRRLPSPALVIACLALFVALGGTVWAATKIDGKRIEPKSLPGNRIAIGSVPGNRLAPNSLGATQIDVGSLPPVPNATHADAADSARRAQTATAADHAADASTINGRSVGCPELTREFAGACWELRARTSAVTAPEAAAICAAGGGELPQPLPFLAFSRQPGIQVATSGEWLGEILSTSDTTYSTYLISVDGGFHLRDPNEQHQFRCVTALLH